MFDSRFYDAALSKMESDLESRVHYTKLQLGLASDTHGYLQRLNGIQHSSPLSASKLLFVGHRVTDPHNQAEDSYEEIEFLFAFPLGLNAARLLAERMFLSPHLGETGFPFAGKYKVASVVIMDQFCAELDEFNGSTWVGEAALLSPDSLDDYTEEANGLFRESFAYAQGGNHRGASELRCIARRIIRQVAISRKIGRSIP
jgi:hypothetical protein